MTADIFRVVDRLNTTLTTERAKIAALEAEVERLKTENHYAYGGRPCDAKGGRLDRSTCGDCSEPGAIELAQADSARWREVAGELAGIARSYLADYGNQTFTDRNGMANTIRAALARFKQESSHDPR